MGDTIKIYTAQWCPDCHAAKRALDEKGLEYEEIDIEENPDAVEIIVAARGKRVLPTLELNGKFIDGNRFNRAKFDADLASIMN